METLLAITAGGIFAASIFMLLRKNLIRVTIGVVLITNAVNLSIFTIGRLTPASPPFIENGAVTANPGIANTLPQALILTAIVIGFGLLAFALTLIYRNYVETDSVVADEIRIAEPLFPGEKIADMDENLASKLSTTKEETPSQSENGSSQ